MAQGKIHHTMGLYPNGSTKHNGVAAEDLEGHIQYQDCRPGRAFFVDGNCIYKGLGISPESIEHWEAELAANPRTFNAPTYPYQ
jgi:hypothetical protein